MSKSDGRDLAPGVDPGREHLIGYEGWPPPAGVLGHMEVFRAFVEHEISGSSLLEVGCGDGSLSRLVAETMPSIKVTGTDQARHPQWDLQTAGDPRFTESSVYDLPFEAGSFDTVVVKDVLHHLPDPAAAVAAMARVAGRRLLVIEANRYNPVSYVRMVRIAKHDHFSRSKLERVLGDRDVRILTVEAHVWPRQVASIGRVHDAVFERLPLLARLRNYNLAVVDV